MTASSPGPHADLIEHAAGIIVASRKQPHTAPGHWAGALWEAGMLVAPGSAPAAATSTLPVCPNCEGEHFTCGACGIVLDAAVTPQPVVDREALVLVGAKAIHRWDKRPVIWEHLDADNVQQYTAESEVVIDAILALLTGSAK